MPAPAARPHSFTPPWLESEIRRHVFPYDRSPLSRLDVPHGPYAIKYVPARYARPYRTAGTRLRISTTAGFTWGTATYAAHIVNPLSSAVFGRAGVVAEYRPYHWSIFDATQQPARDLYLQWVTAQPLYAQLALTAHSNWINRCLRDHFRVHFAIDCVLFHPDQANPHYTRPSDVWLAVSDFLPGGELGTGDSEQFHDAWLAVLVAEEFQARDPQVQIVLDALIGPVTPPSTGPTASADIMLAYLRRSLAYVQL